MGDTQAKIGNSLLKSLISLREEKGELLIEDVGAMLEEMASSLSSDAAHDVFLRSEIEKMADYIVKAKSEIIAMVPDEEVEGPENLSLASSELNEVVKATEDATNTIMDAADAIQDAAGHIDNAEASSKIMDNTMKIYDACSFQDITGQRINKVLRTLEQVEYRVMNLIKLFGGNLPEGYEVPEGLKKGDRPDEALMRGPQLAKDTPSQDDIDKLFDSLE